VTFGLDCDQQSHQRDHNQTEKQQGPKNKKNDKDNLGWGIMKHPLNYAPFERK